MVTADFVGQSLLKNGFGPYTGVPCSILTSLINYIIDHPDIKFYMATSEGEAMGIAAGFTLAGRKPVVLMQNSGLGNCINPITSLHLIYNLKALLLVTLRGEAGVYDEPQHKIMGSITTDLLKDVNIPYEIMNNNEKEFSDQLIRLNKKILSSDSPVALIIRKGTISNYNFKNDSEISANSLLSRKEAIRIIASNITENEAIVSSTGKISRELFFENKNRSGNFYMFGSMGCASAIAFGLAMENPNRKVVVLEGDGSFLMSMGNIATIGHYNPANLIHIILDNECHDSTGGQFTTSTSINLSAITKNCGYKSNGPIQTGPELLEALKRSLKAKGPHFIHVKVLREADKNLGRPNLAPPEVKDMFSSFIKSDP